MKQKSRTKPEAKFGSHDGKPRRPNSDSVILRVMVVEDHPVTRAGIVQLINEQPELEVLHEADGPADAMSFLCRKVPDLLITDLSMPGRGGFEFIKDLLAIQPQLPILVLSMHDESIYAERALRAGARGYITKAMGAEQLIAAVRRVVAGDIYVSDAVSEKIIDKFSGAKPRRSISPLQKLTNREFEVFQLIGWGKGTRDIADELHLSRKTVDVHRARIKEKLQLLDSTALIRDAVRWVETENRSETA